MAIIKKRAAINKFMKLTEPSEYRLLNSKGNIKVFNIIKKKNGNLPAIITIDGFLNQDKDDIAEWEITIKKNTPIMLGIT